MSDDRDRRLNDWNSLTPADVRKLAEIQRELRALQEQAVNYARTLMTQTGDHPVAKRGAAWLVAGAELRRIAHKARPRDPKGYFR
jgi:hypothetical protein